MNEAATDLVSIGEKEGEREFWKNRTFFFFPLTRQKKKTEGKSCVFWSFAKSYYFFLDPMQQAVDKSGYY